MRGRIVFDLDGTLVDSAPDIHAVANAVLAGEGAEPVSLADVRGFIGDGAPVFVTRLREARGLPEADQERLLSDFLERYATAVERTRFYPGVPEALERLVSSDHAMGICTNKPVRPARAVMSHLRFHTFFDALRGGDSLPVRKPDPAPLHSTLEALGEGPALFVGDSEVDAETARRAGVPFLLHANGYRHVPVKRIPHDAAFESWQDMPDLAARLLAR